jgi:hypothetical protein
MKRIQHFGKEDIVFFVLVAIISVSFAYYTKGINEMVQNIRTENNFVAQVNVPVVVPEVKNENTSKTKVLAPNGKEQWLAGETHTIRWEGIPSNTAENKVQILLFPWSVKGDYASTTATAVIAEMVPNSGSFEWTIPKTIPAGDYFVRVFCITFSTCLGSAGDDSDASFRIIKTGLRVAFPNGGEKIKHNFPAVIEWNTSAGIAPVVTVRLVGYLPGSDAIVGTTSVLAANIKNTGELPWTVSPNLPVDYTYYISISAKGGYEDVSDKPFFVIRETEPLTAYCTGTPEGRTIVWKATVQGGLAPYTFSWNGDENITGRGVSFTTRYVNTQTSKQITLTATSADGQQAQTTCGATITQKGK